MKEGPIIFGQNIKIPATVARHHTSSLSRLFVAVKNLIFEGSTIHPECQWGKKSHYCNIKKLITLDNFVFPQIIHLNFLQFVEKYTCDFFRSSSQSILSEVCCHIYDCKNSLDDWLVSFNFTLLAFGIIAMI